MRQLGVFICLGLVGLPLITGCKSSKPGGASHAAVEIQGHSAEQIQATTVVVFAEKGYTLRTNTPTLMFFDRPATAGEKFKYGDWMNDGMVMQIKVRLESLPDDAYLLRADAYTVQDPTDAVFRKEDRIMVFNSKIYRKLLEEVSHRLSSPPPN